MVVGAAVVVGAGVVVVGAGVVVVVGGGVVVVVVGGGVVVVVVGAGVVVVVTFLSLRDARSCPLLMIRLCSSYVLVNSVYQNILGGGRSLTTLEEKLYLRCIALREAHQARQI